MLIYFIWITLQRKLLHVWLTLLEHHLLTRHCSGHSLYRIHCFHISTFLKVHQCLYHTIDKEVSITKMKCLVQELRTTSKTPIKGCFKLIWNASILISETAPGRLGMNTGNIFQTLEGRLLFLESTLYLLQSRDLWRKSRSSGLRGLRDVPLGAITLRPQNVPKDGSESKGNEGNEVISCDKCPYA